MSTPKTNDKLYVPLIGILSVVIPAVVAILIFFRFDTPDSLGNVDFLPTLNAAINSTVSVLLVLGLIFAKRKMLKVHRFVMVTALILSVFFLVSYVIYHYAHGDVKYNGEGGIKVFYLLILATHILLSIVVVPLALFAVYRGFTDQRDKHRKIVRWAWPIWLYVSVTGVLVYLMVHVFNPVAV